MRAQCTHTQVHPTYNIKLILTFILHSFSKPSTNLQLVWAMTAGDRSDSLGCLRFFPRLRASCMYFYTKRTGHRHLKRFNIPCFLYRKTRSTGLQGVDYKAEDFGLCCGVGKRSLLKLRRVGTSRGRIVCSRVQRSLCVWGDGLWGLLSSGRSLLRACKECFKASTYQTAGRQGLFRRFNR